MNLFETFRIDVNMDFTNTNRGDLAPKILSLKSKKQNVFLDFGLCYYLNFLDFGFLIHFSIQGLTWAALGLRTQNHPQVVGTCPGHVPLLIAQNLLSKRFGPEPPLKATGYLTWAWFF